MIKYLITEPDYNYDNFCDADFVCFRDKKTKDFENKAKLFIKKAQKEGIKNIFLSEYYLLAKKLGATGVQLTSKQHNRIPQAKKYGLKVSISCHTKHDIENAIQKNVDIIIYSPIFKTPNKGMVKGIFDLKKVVLLYDVKIIALGGIITDLEVKQIEETGAYGFASIRYFLKD